MKEVFAYVRVSTTRQGEHGVSLLEQRDAITRYAQRNSLQIREWFEEQQTAAKRGRPVFGRLLKKLLRKEVGGLVIHKIDRSARNLKDWADLGELIDQGIEVHLAHEALDLRSRGGRLTADIQAVVAADYIRNLREECRKGFYGRLKQGVYPRPAPLGYADQGAGKPKVPAPHTAALVKQAFELYSTGRFSLKALSAEMFRRGLRNKHGRRIRVNEVANMLHNPFYVGLMRIKKTGETFEGQHQPIISTALFNRVQQVLEGKAVRGAQCHDFIFRRLLRCGRCHRALVGERQKGHVYYRCHNQECSGTSIREEVVETEVVRLLQLLTFSDTERRYFDQELQLLARDTVREQEQRKQGLTLQRDQLVARLNRLTDTFLDGMIERDMFEERKTALLVERREVEDRLENLTSESSVVDTLNRVLELADGAYLLYENGLSDEKRELLEIVCSNREVEAKTPMLTLASPFDELARRSRMQHGGPSRVIVRTVRQILRNIVNIVAGDSRLRSYLCERLRKLPEAA